MSKPIHKGTELNNVKETWEQNERERTNTNRPVTSNDNLDDKIQEEARQYDDANKEDRLLSGDRASVNDDSRD